MKKILTVFVLCTVCICCAIGFAACEDDNGNIIPTPTVQTHEFVDTVINPTCTADGYTLHECSCGEKYIDTYTNALGHNFGAWTETTAPTCTTKGVETRYCSRDNTHTETRETDKLQHEFTNYISDNNATYDDDGTKTAYCNHGCGEKNTVTDTGTKLQSGIAFKTLAVDGNNVYGKIPNTQTEFDFLTEIEKKGNVTYEVSRNLAGDDIIMSKTAEPSVGNNNYYILVYQNGDLLSRYNVTIRRREIFDVTFNTNGGTMVESQRIEEDNFATEPTTELAGYTFTCWDYNFDKPITENTVIAASWTANTDTKYKAEYYLQNLDDDNYTLDFTDNLTGTTDTQAAATIKAYNHFTHIVISDSIESSNINGNGTTVLKVYYARNNYLLTVNNENTKGGTIDCTDNGSYRFGKQINLSATVNAGYDFIGWYSGNTQISDKLEYSFTLTGKNDITAKYFAQTDTSYKVEYYFENLDGTYTLQNTEEKFGETDTIAIITPNTPEHYVINENKSILSGNINGDTTTVLKVYYARKMYSVKLIAGGNVTLNRYVGGTYKYGTIISEVQATFENYLGYDEWQGWHNGDDVLTYDKTISAFTVKEDLNYIADFSIKEEMQNFNFTSTETECRITGIKDKNVKEIIIPDYVTLVAQSAFSDCSCLINITIPDSVTYIGEYAFSGCSSLTTITIPNSVTYLGAYVFYGCSSLSNIIISNNVTYIRYSSFKGCSSLTSITIPNGVTEIGREAFYDCSNLTSINMPDSVGYIGDMAFYRCSSLKSITMPNSNITSIHSNAFYGCSNLTSITIPIHIWYIREKAFYGCSSLTDIHFKGTKAQWTNITKESMWNYKVPATVVHCSDGDINI